MPQDVHVNPQTLWTNVSRKDFGDWIQSNDVEYRQFCQRNWEVYRQRQDNMPLRMMYRGELSHANKSDITFIKPIFHRQTLANEDIEYIVQKFYQKHMENTDRTCAVISGDWQVWIKLWVLHVKQPEKYNWMIPVPGEWHWTWHILQAIYQQFYSTVLLPLSQHLCYSKLDEKAKVFHYAEDFLELVTCAVGSWIKDRMRDSQEDDVNTWLHSIKHHRNAYELAYACIHYFVPYWLTRSALKWNRYEEMENWWRYWLHLFIACGKHNYTLMTIRVLWMWRSLNPRVKAVYDMNRVVSFSGGEGSGIPYDEMCEIVCINTTAKMLHS